MTIIERPLNGFNNKLSYSKLNYPQCTCQDSQCPRFYFNAIYCASRSSGKTYSCCTLIKHYEKHNIVKDGNIHPIRTFLISPTIDANPIFSSLKSLDMEKDTYDTY